MIMDLILYKFKGWIKMTNENGKTVCDLCKKQPQDFEFGNVALRFYMPQMEYLDADFECICRECGEKLYAKFQDVFRDLIALRGET